MMLEKVTSYYARLRHQHGDESPLSLGWSIEGQSRRFNIVDKALPFGIHSLLDIGCGFGHLSRYLVENRPNLRYTGWDIDPSYGKFLSKDHRFKFETRNIIDSPPKPESYDAVVAVGTFNVHFGHNDDAVRKALSVMFASASKMALLSVLSIHADEVHKHADNWYYDPLELFTFARGMTRYVDLLHGYMPHDFTLILYRR